jgi:hypothetical protein
MGLDTVELILAIEEEFGVEIPDEKACEMSTPRHVADFLLEQLPLVSSEGCSTQRTFYQLRRGLRSSIGFLSPLTPQTPLQALITKKGWKHLWYLLHQTVGNSEWPERIPWRDLFHEGPQNLRELTRYVAMHRPRPENGHPWTREQVELTLRRVIYDQTNLFRFTFNDTFAYDMGLC